MKRWLAVAVCLFVAGCESEEAKRQREEQLQREIEASKAERQKQVAQLLGAPDALEPKYTDPRVEFCNNGPIRRLCVKVRVPRGLAREDLEQNMRHALLTHFMKWGGAERLLGAVSVLAYASPNLDAPYDAAEAVFAPGGVWSRADQAVPVSDWRPTIDVHPDYLKPRVEIAVGTKAVLKPGEFSKAVYLSRSASSWRDPDIIARLSAGVPVVVVGKEDFGVAGVRYQVETTRGAKKRGWVHAAELAVR